VAPSNVTAVPFTKFGKFGFVQVSWSPVKDYPPDNGGLPIKGQVLTCRSGSSVLFQKSVSAFANVQTFGVAAFPLPSVRAGGTSSFSCTVMAVNAAGAGPESAPGSFTL
jgi:hypothetical protein